MDYLAEIEKLVFKMRQERTEQKIRAVDAAGIEKRFVSKATAMEMLGCKETRLKELKKNGEINYTDTLPAMYEVDSLNEYLSCRLRGRNVVPKRRKRN